MLLFSGMDVQMKSFSVFLADAIMQMNFASLNAFWPIIEAKTAEANNSTFCGARI